jgi:hypothetical protein
MKKKEEEVENYTNGYGRGFEVGYTHGWNMAKGGLQWTDVMEEQPPKDTLILYFFECTGVSAGYYDGRCDEYPGENNHVFGGGGGFLTGDVTHWMHMPGEPKPHVDLSDSVRVERHYDDGTSETETIKMPD